MSEYAYRDLLKMQEEATQRVREMNKRSVFATADAQKKLENPHRISLPVEYDLPRQNPTVQRERKAESDTDTDTDTALILSLLILLNGENADPSLTMALTYLLL